MVVETTDHHLENQITIYKFFEGKPQSFVSEIIGEDYQGVLMTDGLKAYVRCSREGSRALFLSSLDHTRRLEELFKTA